MEVDFEKLKQEYKKLVQELNSPELISDWERFEKISKRKKKLENIIQKSEELEKTIKEEKESESILASESDPELVSLAESEIEILKGKRNELEKILRKLVNRLDSEDETEEKSGSVIVEIRAGTGGDEAALFAENLFRMYSRYAQKRNWQIKILDANRTEIGGYKEVVFELKNGDVYSFMKYEGGVHRVQRVPETEKQGRIHTSTISVATLIKPKKGIVKVNPADLKVDTYKASGPGGQYVNKRETAIRITHLPTNIVVASQNERSLAQNKENAMSILEAKILEKSQNEANEKLKKERNEQVGNADRSEKIRTYNFLQDRVTDHRIKKSWHNMESILNGNIDSIIESLQKQIQ
jgi:peptide chain release factor 1